MRFQGITPAALQIREFAGDNRGGAGWREDERLFEFFVGWVEPITRFLQARYGETHHSGRRR